MLLTQRREYLFYGHVLSREGVSGVATLTKVRFRNGRFPTFLLLLLSITAQNSASQTVRDLDSFLREDVGLTDEQIANIRAGKAVVKAVQSPTPDKVFLFGAIYIQAAPESYVNFHNDFDRLRRLPKYLALGVFSNPPQLSDLKGFTLDSDDIKSLKNCKPSSCLIQLPASSIEQTRQSIDWAADAD